MKFEDLRSEMVKAMKARDKDTKDAISLLVAAVKKEAIDKGMRDDVPEEIVDSVIAKETKIMKEQLDTCPDSREDLKALYTFRYNVFCKYAPKMMSLEEIEAFINEHFADLVASKNKGMLMKSCMAELKGKADGKDVNAAVTKICS